MAADAKIQSKTFVSGSKPHGHGPFYLYKFYSFPKTADLKFRVNHCVGRLIAQTKRVNWLNGINLFDPYSNGV